VQAAFYGSNFIRNPPKFFFSLPLGWKTRSKILTIAHLCTLCAWLSLPGYCERIQIDFAERVFDAERAPLPDNTKLNQLLDVVNDGLLAAMTLHSKVTKRDAHDTVDAGAMGEFLRGMEERFMELTKVPDCCYDGG